MFRGDGTWLGVLLEGFHFAFRYPSSFALRGLVYKDGRPLG